MNSETGSQSAVTIIFVLFLIGLMAGGYYILKKHSPGQGIKHAAGTLSKPLDQARIMGCMTSVSNIRMAEEMYRGQSGAYTDDLDKLAMYLDRSCTDEDGRGDGCARAIEKFDEVCEPGSVEVLIGSGGSEYVISAISPDDTKCPICVTSQGATPEDVKQCGDGTAPQCAVP